MLEIRTATAAEPESCQPYYQYVWSRRYIDAPVRQFGNFDSDDLCDDLSLYFSTDANMNVTAAYLDYGASTSLVIHYDYTAYGEVRCYLSNWQETTLWPSSCVPLFCGYLYDAETGLYQVRHRYLLPPLGRWTTRDPAGYVDGYNCYAAYFVPSSVDPLGLGKYDRPMFDDADLRNAVVRNPELRRKYWDQLKEYYPNGTVDDPYGKPALSLVGGDTDEHGGNQTTAQDATSEPGGAEGVGSAGPANSTDPSGLLPPGHGWRTGKRGPERRGAAVDIWTGNVLGPLGIGASRERWEAGCCTKSVGDAHSWEEKDESQFTKTISYTWDPGAFNGRRWRHGNCLHKFYRLKQDKKKYEGTISRAERKGCGWMWANPCCKYTVKVAALYWHVYEAEKREEWIGELDSWNCNWRLGCEGGAMKLERLTLVWVGLLVVAVLASAPWAGGCKTRNGGNMRVVGHWFRAGMEGAQGPSGLGQVLIFSADGRYRLLTLKGPAAAPREVYPMEDGQWHLAGERLELRSSGRPSTRYSLRLIGVREGSLVVESAVGEVLTFNEFSPGEFPLVDRATEGRGD